MKNVKIGIIVDKYHLELKVTDLLTYLKNLAELNLYIEESYFLKSSKVIFDEDVFFVKTKGNLALSLLKLIENETSIPIVNPSKAIWNSMHRFLACTLLRKAKIPVPKFSLSPLNSSIPFKDYIVKNIIDQKNYNFTPKIEKISEHFRVYDERALNEATGKENYQYYFYQDFINSKWEYKVYGIGDELQFFYKQIPILYNPNKMESRKKIDMIPELSEYSHKAMRVLNLRLTSIDYLQSEDGQYYLTDINPTPNFNYIKGGPKIVGDYLIQLAKI
jgi:glutathione synthase/RimK-type ligase-like ATP-grasp enzyme